MRRTTPIQTIASSVLAVLFTIGSLHAAEPPVELETKRYSVNQASFEQAFKQELLTDKADGNENQDALAMMLAALGVGFPTGAFVRYEPEKARLILRNTPENFHHLEEILWRINMLPRQVSAEVTVVSLSRVKLEDLLREGGTGAIAGKEFVRLWKEGQGNTEQTGSLVTQPGQNTTSEPETSLVLNMTPVLGPEARDIEFALNNVLSGFRVDTSVILADRHSLFVGGALDPKDPQSIRCMFLKPTVLSIDGKPLSESPAEKRFREAREESLAKRKLKQAEVDKIRKKMSGIIIPSIELRAVPIDEVFRFIASASEKATPKSKPVKFKLDPSLFATTGGASNFDQRDSPFDFGDADFGAAFDKELQADPKDDSNLPRITLSLRRVSLLDAVRYITEVANLKYRFEKDTVLILPANFAYEPVITRIYPVHPSAFESLTNRVSREESESETKGDDEYKPNWINIDHFFVSMGVPFPKGRTSIKYFPTISCVVIQNTWENIEIFERILTQIDITPIQVEVTAMEVTFSTRDLDEFARKSVAAAPAPTDLKGLWQEGKGTLSGYTTVTARTGLRTTAEVVQEELGKKVGAILNATPTVGIDLQTIDLTLAANFSKAATESKPTTSNITLGNGQTLVLSGTSHPSDPEITTYLFVAATIVDQKGNRLQRGTE